MVNIIDILFAGSRGSRALNALYKKEESDKVATNFLKMLDKKERNLADIGYVDPSTGRITREIVNY